MALLTTLSLVALASSPLPPPQAEERIPILVVSGANNHDWEWTSPSLVRILDETGRFDVEITYEPAKDLADRAKLDAFKAVVLDYNGKRWGNAAEETFLAAVQDGLGVVVIHAADNHGPGWEEYERLVGDLWRAGTGHGRFHPFDVKVVDRDHPITRTLPTLLKHPDELYHNLVNVHGVERRVLATAYSASETGGTGEDEPMIIVRNYGKGRMFHSPLGHVWSNSAPSQASHRDPQFRGLVVRGTEWAATGSVRDERRAELEDVTNGLEDMAVGRTSLMDPALWQSLNGDDVREGWRFEDDLLVRTARAGDIVTRALHDDFELTFQWKTTVAGNSGIKYRIPPGAKQPIGPEYQLLDPASTTRDEKQRAGALYAVVATREGPYVPWGEFHDARIVVQGSRIEHWVDGVLVVNADTSSPEWKAAIADSKFKDVAGFAAAGPGRILIQDHGDEVWIRDLMIRPIVEESDDQASAPSGVWGHHWTPAFPTSDLAGWSNVGDATYAVEAGTLIGNAGPNKRQSFLVSNETFGDFTLEVDVKIAVLGNSGIQLRSHVNDKGRLQGYQAEIDPTDRSWSAGIFDEGRRGWLNDLKENEPARKAFDRAGWNRYRIECDGPQIRTWLNGVPAADLLDGEDLTGSLGFQIHGGDDDIQIHWRDARIARYGAHAWIPFESGSKAYEFKETRGVRMDIKGDGTELQFSDADGTLVRVVPISAHERWAKDASNRVTVLRDGDRFVIQLGDRTTHDLKIEGVASVSPDMPLEDPLIENWYACRKSSR